MITFVKATPADAPALTAVQTRCFDDDSRRFLGRETGGPPGYDSVDWQIEYMQRGHYYTIRANGQIIGGMIIFHMKGGHYVLGRIYLDPDFQNQGIGTQAMMFIETEFPRSTTWSLDTPAWATRNHHFYEKLGYVKVGEQGSGEDREFNYKKTISR